MKQKTHSGAKKRFKLSGSKKKAKVIGKKAAIRHLLVNKSKSQKKMAGKARVLAPGDARVIRQLLNH